MCRNGDNSQINVRAMERKGDKERKTGKPTETGLTHAARTGEY
jgi:hypothetical protein